MIQSTSFDIVVGTANNIEWVEPFLLSLSCTLFDKNRVIRFIDGSTDENYYKLQKVYTYGLQVTYEKDIWSGSGGAQHSSKVALLKSIDGESVCCCDVDILFLMKNWDAFVSILLRSPFDLVGLGGKVKTATEGSFFVGNRLAIIESRFGHCPRSEWDENIMKIPVVTEHSYITYCHVKNGGIFFPLNRDRRKSGNRWGVVSLTDWGQEFLYHNFYSARCKKNAICKIPPKEYQRGKELIDHCEDNAFVLMKYMQTIWPGSLSQFIKTV